jgi:hypothetical protein
MFETRSDRRVLCPAPSARLWKTFRDDGERDSGLTQKVFAITPERSFTINPELCSELSRNRVRLHPGTAFGIARNTQLAEDDPRRAENLR